MKSSLARAAVEAGFIIILFYSNLLMGEYERSGMGRRHGLVWALHDIFTLESFIIAGITSVAAYILIEVLRRRL